MDYDTSWLQSVERFQDAASANAAVHRIMGASRTPPLSMKEVPLTCLLLFSICSSRYKTCIRTRYLGFFIKHFISEFLTSWILQSYPVLCSDYPSLSLVFYLSPCCRLLKGLLPPLPTRNDQCDHCADCHPFCLVLSWNIYASYIYVQRQRGQRHTYSLPDIHAIDRYYPHISHTPLFYRF